MFAETRDGMVIVVSLALATKVPLSRAMSYAT
jgi:hypothetical protein